LLVPLAGGVTLKEMVTFALGATLAGNAMRLLPHNELSDGFWEPSRWFAAAVHIVTPVFLKVTLTG
jgi:hypothetical protein